MNKTNYVSIAILIVCMLFHIVYNRYKVKNPITKSSK